MRRHFFLFVLICLCAQSNWAKNKALEVALSSDPTNLSPFFSTDASSQNINRLVHASLIDFDRQMNAICRLCTVFSEELDKKTGQYFIHFTLKPNLQFHDATPLTSESIKHAWKLFTDEEKIKSIFRFAFSNIEDIKIHDSLKFTLIYKNFAPDHLSNLVLFKILKLSKSDSIDPLELIGAGEYQFEKVEPLQVHLKSRVPSLSDLNFKVVKDETTLALKLMNQEVDLSLVNLSARKIVWLKSNAKDVDSFEIDGTNYNYLALNHTKFPMNDLRFRKALSHLIPREDLAKSKLRGTVTLASSMYSSAFGSLHLDFPIDSYDVEKAKRLFLEMGLEYKNNFWHHADKKIKLNWKVTNNRAIIEIVTLLKEVLGKNGIDVEMSIQEWGTFMQAFKSADFDILMSRWVGFTGPEMMNYVFSSESIPPKGANRGHFQNKEVDTLLESAAKSWKQAERVKLYQDALKLIDKNYPYISLWHPKVIWLGKKCLTLKPYPNESFMAFLDLKNNCHEN